MKDEAALKEVQAKIEGGTPFADMAKEHSTCPSGAAHISRKAFPQDSRIPSHFPALSRTGDPPTNQPTNQT